MRRGTALAVSILVCATVTGCGTDDDGVEVSAGIPLACSPLVPGRALTVGAGQVDIPSGSRVRIYPVQLEGRLALRDAQTVLVPPRVGVDGSRTGLGATYDDLSTLEGETVVPPEGIELRGPVSGLGVGLVLYPTGPTRITGAPIRYSVLDGPTEVARAETIDARLEPRCN